MDYIVIEGARPYDGRYEFDLTREFTTREWGWVKRFSGYLPLTFEDGLRGADAELFTAFAVVALHRAGRIDTRDVPFVFDSLQDNPLGVIRYESDVAEEGEDDASPPEQKPNENANTLGAGSKTNLENSDSSPPATGRPDLVTSESDPMRLAN